MSKYYIYILTLGFIFIISCSSEKLDSDQSDIQFSVNTNLLSKSIYLDNSKISFRPPIGWDELSSDQINIISEVVNSTENVFDIKLNKAFQSLNGAMIIISSIKNTIENFGYIPSNYMQLLSEQFKVDDIMLDNFKIHQVPVKQFLINTKDVVIIKLFISDNVDYQLDYIVPKKVYEEELKKIESSIGSINTIKGE